MKENFTTWDIQKKLGIKRDRLKEWLERKYIVPSVQQATGVGTKNLFSRWDLYLIGFLDTLIKFQVSRATAAMALQLVTTMKKTNPALLENWHYITLSGLQDEDGGVSFNFVLTIKGKSQTESPSVATDEMRSWKDDFDYILTVNFKKIRERIDRLIG